MEKNPHHLIMGELTDFLSGEPRADTHDERYRQKLARLLVQDLGYDPKQIQQNRGVIIRNQGQSARIIVDFLVSVDSGVFMLIKYAPGSLVTRRLSNLALSRIIFSYQIPVVVTTNGEDAEVFSGRTGKVMGQGLSAIPSRKDALTQTELAASSPIGQDLFEKATKIAYACEVDGACPCDTGVCLMDED